jgi:hypothetical protein
MELIPVSQDPEELMAMLKSLDPVNSMLEIGHLYGFSFDLMARFLNTKIAVAIDFPGAAYGAKDTLPAVKQIHQNLARDGIDTRLIIGDSKDEKIIKQSQEFGPYDFLYIDGDHSYEGARSDFHSYKAKQVAFHDIANPKMGVGTFWDEIKWNYNFSEFVFHDGTDGKKMHLGIGVIYNAID